MRRRFEIQLIALLIFTLVLSSCGGSGGDSSSSGQAAGGLTSIKVNPDNSVLIEGTTMQFTAMGTYGDGSVHNLTGSAGWASSDKDIATISNDSDSKGAATATASGPVTITAKIGGISGSTIVNAKRLMGGSVQGAALKLNNEVTTIAGSANGQTLLESPSGITTDGKFLYIVDSGHNRIRQIDFISGDVSTLIGETGSFQLNNPVGITTDGKNLYVTDQGNNRIVKIDAGGNPQALVISGVPLAFNGLSGITTDGANLYVSDTNNNRVVQINLKTLSGSVILDSRISADFASPDGITTDGKYLYVGTASGAIYVERIADAAFYGKLLDAKSSLNHPDGLTSDGKDVYVADTQNCTIRKITGLDVSEFPVFLGSKGECRFADGNSKDARFTLPVSITTDGVHLYVADYGSNTIRKISGQETLFQEARRSYAVAYNINGGSGVVPGDGNTYQQGKTVTVPGNTGNLTRTGYAFAGWNTAADGSGTTYQPGQSFTMFHANSSLYARWDANNYVVNFDAQGGTPTPVQQSVAYGDTLIRPQNPTKYGYSFAGWFTDSVYTTQWDFGRDTVTSNLTLFAKWTALSRYTVSFNTGSGGTAIPSQNVYAGGTVSRPTPDPTRSGYAFSGWYKEPDCVTSWNFSTDTVSSDVTIYAKWTGAYKVIYKANGGTGDVPAIAEYPQGYWVKIARKPDSLVRDGRSFNGWIDTSGKIYEPTYNFQMPAHDVTLYAIWEWPIGTRTSYSADGIAFSMRSVPGGVQFPIGTMDLDTGKVDRGYWIAETEVTYALWKKVYDWATSVDRGANKYTFENAGTLGSSGSGDQTQPVTNVRWRDAVVWTNALTEWLNAMTGSTYDCVYNKNGVPIRNATTNDSENAIPTANAKGFRLPSSDEWELAARYRTDTTNIVDCSARYCSGMHWTKGNSVSGAPVNYYSSDETNASYGWFYYNSGGSKGSTQPVAQKNRNSLGLYDMSGNVVEWYFAGKNGSYPVAERGGGWRDDSIYLQIGGYARTGFSGSYVDAFTGFRIVRTEY